MSNKPNTEGALHDDPNGTIKRAITGTTTPTLAQPEQPRHALPMTLAAVSRGQQIAQPTEPTLGFGFNVVAALQPKEPEKNPIEPKRPKWRARKPRGSKNGSQK